MSALDVDGVPTHTEPADQRAQEASGIGGATLSLPDTSEPVAARSSRARAPCRRARLRACRRHATGESAPPGMRASAAGA
jgi:hypothetical protein